MLKNQYMDRQTDGRKMTDRWTEGRTDWKIQG